MIGGAGKIYYGWVVMAVCMVAMMLLVGTTINAYSLFVLPVSNEYGLSRADTNTGMILMNFGAAIAALFVGRMLDRYSPRTIMRTGAVLLSASLIALSQIRDLWLSMIVLALPMGFAMSAVGTLTGPALISRWFKAQRGRAMAIMVMGMASATILVVPPLAWLLDAAGWRTTLLVMGCVTGTVILGLSPLVRDNPGPNDHERAAPVDAPAAAAPVEDAPSRPPTTLELLQSARFWMIATSTALIMGVVQGLMLSIVPIGGAAGFSTAKSAGLISALGLAALLSKAVVAAVGDRFERPVLLFASYILISAANVALMVADTFALLVMACCLLGLASGAAKPLYLALLGDEYGPRSFGNATGNVTFMIALLGAAAMRFAGEVYDRTGAYTLMFATFAALSLVSAVVVLLLRYRPVRHLNRAAVAG